MSVAQVATRVVDEHDLKNARAIYDFVILYIEWAKRHPNKIMMPVDTTADAVTLTHQGTVRQVPSGSKFNEIIGALTPENNIIALNVTEMYKDVHAIATSFLTQTSYEWTHCSDSADHLLHNRVSGFGMDLIIAKGHTLIVLLLT